MEEVVECVFLFVGQRPCQLPDAAGEEVEGVLHRSSSPDGLGVDGDFEGMAFEKTGALGFFDTGEEDALDLWVQNKVSAEELEGTLGAERLSGFFAQNSCPAQIVGGPGDGFLIGDARLMLQQEGECEQGGRDTGSSLFVGIEGGEVFVVEEPGGGVCELGMDTAGCQGEVKDVTDFKQGLLVVAFSDHASILLQSGQGWR